jgi:hypothetical protein
MAKKQKNCNLLLVICSWFGICKSAKEKLTKIGLFDKGRLMGLTRLSDDDITEELPNHLLLLKETLCCNLDLCVIKQCGCCCALDD